MNVSSETDRNNGAPSEATSTNQLQRLLDRPATASSEEIGGVVVGELLAITDNGRTPLVIYPRQPGVAALAARSVVDLHAAHVGRQVVLVFEDADRTKPIIVGSIRSDRDASLETRPGQVEVESDGERLIVSAKEQLVLRCGEASITLTKEGEVLLRGTYLSTHASGVNRIKGGSVQIN
jgi:hypothetical protein